MLLAILNLLQIQITHLQKATLFVRKLVNFCFFPRLPGLNLPSGDPFLKEYHVVSFSYHWLQSIN